MISLLLSGVRYDCDGTSISATLGEQTFGSCRIADAKLLDSGSYYMTFGPLHAVLTQEAVAILRGEAPLPETVEAAPSEAETPSEEPAPKPKRKR